MTASTKERDYSLDFIRIFAVFLVLSVHSMKQLGFYDHVVSGNRYLAACIMRHFFMACVPLFIILSGYLMNRKTLSRRYFLGLIHILITYVLASLACVPFHYLFENKYNLFEIILKLLDFTLAPYAWYIEMYIGLFLMMPFLNHMYHGCRSRREKEYLLLFMVLLTAVPKITNIFFMENTLPLSSPLRLLGHQKILPEFFTSLYPLAYYLIGCYLSEFRPHISAKKLGILLLLQTLLGGFINYFINEINQIFFEWGSWQDYGSIMNMITAVLIFTLFLQIDITDWNIKLKKSVQYLSGLSLGIYLVSWIFDSIYYKAFLSGSSDQKLHIELYLPLTLLVYFSSACVSAFLKFLQNKFIGFISCLHEKSRCSQ